MLTAVPYTHLDVYKRQREQGEHLAAELGRLILSDLPESVKSATKWTIEPDGALNLVPFEALPTARGKPLLSAVDIGLSLIHI